MSKRGGNSEVNGFISLNSDEKKTSRKKDGTVTNKRGGEDKDKRKRDPDKDLSKNTAQNRSRMSEGKSKVESSKVLEGKSSKTSSLKVKNETGSMRKSESNLVVKDEIRTPSDRLRKPSRNTDSRVPTTQEIKKSLSESLVKSKQQISSPYISGTKKKTVKSSTSINKPLKDSHAQVPQPRTSSHASGDKLKKTSQLNDTPLKSKLSTNIKTASKSSVSKPQATVSGKVKKSSSSSLSKPKTTLVPTREEKYESAYEESESQQNVRAFEIPRSNTFTKEGKAPDSLTSDLSISQSQECDSLDQAEGGEYNYDDDFEDYESDFEEYMASSEDGSSKTEEDREETSLSSSDSETPDEDEYGDGLKAELCTPQEKPPVNDIPLQKSILKQRNDLRFTNDTKEKQNEGEKLLTVEEERKLDSGSYDLANHVDLRRKKQIQDIRAAMEKENASLISQSSHHKTRSITEDEGFVEVYSQEATSYLDATGNSSNGLINFADARKQQIKQKAKAKMSKRGVLLMEMIKLDVMSFNILDIPSVPYEVYMQCYGRSNTYQIHTQTNEDAINEEVQTDDIVVDTKWTQHPVKYSSPKSPDKLLFIFSQEKLGVGGENTVKGDDDWLPKLHVNSLRLHNFINNAGEMILTLLEENQEDRRSEVSHTTNKRDYGFSDSFTSLNVKKVDFLKGRPVSIVCFSESNSTHILSVHKPSTEQPLTVQAESEGRCVLCTWSIREPSCPLQTLVASNDVSSVCFHSHLVFAGLVDGVICLWDLREQSTIHCRCFLKLPDWLLRSPTYISAGLERDKRHLSSVVSIKILPESNPDDSAKTTTDQTPTQVVTLDESGLLMVWTVVETRTAVNIDTGLAPWGKVRLVQSSQLRVLKAFPRSEQAMIQCRCLEVDRLKPSNLYIGTNAGQVTHCLQSSTRAKPQFYTPRSDNNTTITCMDFSKCGFSIFMVGDTSGRVQIYRTMTERPLLDIAASAADPSPPVKSVQWSPTQPGLFFVLDANSSIHVWDLCASDMCPQMTVPFTSQVLTSIALTPHPNSRLMAAATEAGKVNVFNLKTEFCALPKDKKEEQHKIFSRYINIL